MFHTEHAFPRDRSPNSLRTERGLLQLLAHRPIVIDDAGADGSAEGSCGVEPGPSNDDCGDGSLDRSSFPVPALVCTDCFLGYSSARDVLEPVLQ